MSAPKSDAPLRCRSFRAPSGAHRQTSAGPRTSFRNLCNDIRKAAYYTGRLRPPFLDCIRWAVRRLCKCLKRQDEKTNLDRPLTFPCYSSSFQVAMLRKVCTIGILAVGLTFTALHGIPVCGRLVSSDRKSTRLNSSHLGISYA